MFFERFVDPGPRSIQPSRMGWFWCWYRRCVFCVRVFVLCFEVGVGGVGGGGGDGHDVGVGVGGHGNRGGGGGVGVVLVVVGVPALPLLPICCYKCFATASRDADALLEMLCYIFLI